MRTPSFSTLARGNPALRFLAAHTVGDVSVLMDDPYPRATGWIRLNDPKVVDFIEAARFLRNRVIDEANVAYLLREHTFKRLTPTNIIAFALDSAGNLLCINGAHTNRSIGRINGTDGMEPLISAFQWVVWFNIDMPEDDAMGDMESTLYARYDAGKGRTPANRQDALQTAERLGISKKQRNHFNAALTIMLGEGHNTLRGEAKSIGRSVDDRFILKRQFLAEHTRYSEIRAMVPGKSTTGVHLTSKKMLSHAAVTAAFLQAYHHEPSGKMVEFMDGIANAEFELGSPQHTLWRFFTDSESEWVLSVKGGSQYHPLFTATLLALRAHVDGKKFSFRKANSLLRGNLGTVTEHNVAFDDFIFDYRTYQA